MICGVVYKYTELVDNLVPDGSDLCLFSSRVGASQRWLGSWKTEA